MGAISKAILQAGGSSIQTELRHKRQGKELNYGEIVDSSAGKMSCKQIFHTALDKYDSSGKSEKVIAWPITSTKGDRNHNKWGSGAKKINNICGSSTSVVDVF